MRSILKSLLTLGFILGLTGCLSYPIPPYAVSVENVSTAKQLKEKKITLQLGEIKTSNDANNSEAMCRAAGPVKITDGRSYAKYIADALKDEMTLAEVISAKAPNELSIHFQDVEFRTGGGSKWIINSEITYNGQVASINVEQAFEGSFMAQNACTEIANNFPIIVRKYNSAVLNKLTSFKSKNP